MQGSRPFHFEFAWKAGVGTVRIVWWKWWYRSDISSRLSRRPVVTQVTHHLTPSLHYGTGNNPRKTFDADFMQSKVGTWNTLFPRISVAFYKLPISDCILSCCLIRFTTKPGKNVHSNTESWKLWNKWFLLSGYFVWFWFWMIQSHSKISHPWVVRLAQPYVLVKRPARSVAKNAWGIGHFSDRHLWLLIAKDTIASIWCRHYEVLRNSKMCPKPLIKWSSTTGLSLR